MNVLLSWIVITGGPTLIFTGMVDLPIGPALPSPAFGSCRYVRSGYRRPCQMKQEQAVVHRDGCPWISGRDHRDFLLAHLDNFLADSNDHPSFQHLERDAALLISLVESGPGTERYEH